MRVTFRASVGSCAGSEPRVVGGGSVTRKDRYKQRAILGVSQIVLRGRDRLSLSMKLRATLLTHKSPWGQNCAYMPVPWDLPGKPCVGHFAPYG